MSPAFAEPPLAVPVAPSETLVAPMAYAEPSPAASPEQAPATPLALSAVAPVVVAWPSPAQPVAPSDAAVPEGDGRGAWTGDVFAPADLEVGAAPDPAADPDAFPVDLLRDVP